MTDTGCCPIVDKFSIKLSRFLQGTVFVEKLNVFRETKQMLDLLKLSFVINHSGLLTGQVLRGVWNSQSANGSPELITVDQSQAWNPSPQNPFLGSGKEENILFTKLKKMKVLCSQNGLWVEIMFNCDQFSLVRGHDLVPSKPHTQNLPYPRDYFNPIFYIGRVGDKNNLGKLLKWVLGPKSTIFVYFFPELWQ